LSKILQGLVRAKILASKRGVGGGLSLAESPKNLTILDVVNAVDPIARIHVCPLGIATHGARLCPLHRRLDAALEATERAFAKTTLADILNEPSRSVPLCDVSQKSRSKAGR
jgi:Rrf2 family protein